MTAPSGGSGEPGVGLHRSQQQAALAVRRVLGGQTLSAALVAVGANDAGPARPLIHELAYGTLRHHGLLDALVRALAAKPIPDRDLASLVAVALYQLEHTSAPPFAIVDQAVRAAADIARPAAKPLVNAMLRRFLRERATLVERVQGDPVARWSHPRWWIERVRADHPDHWQDVLAAGNERPPLALRVNARRTSREALLARFDAAGIGAHAAGAAGVLVATPRPVRELPGFDDGEISVQDLGAQLAAPLLRVQDGMRVLDACAAPGGKTAHLLELAAIDVVALDDDAARLARVAENLARLRLDVRNVRMIVGDAAAPDAWWDGAPFDRILADVPCTASGVVRRHPDGKWLRRPDDVAAFAAKQRAILDACWSLLAPGGELLYATCSVFGEENEARVAEFAASHADALREPITFAEGVAHSGGQLLPSLPGAVHNQDGFFYSRLRKD
jgi:16S rRNA (cytosine967-C5)-methyltransferase